MKDKQIQIRVHCYSPDELPESLKTVVRQACEASVDAYAPYSNFAVGAAVMLENGQVITGNNQENVAYPSGLCAERVALFAASSQYPSSAPTVLAVAARPDAKVPDVFTSRPVTPCGSCRQVLSEIERRYGKPVKLVLYGSEVCYVLDSAADLMPLGFEF